ncbi:hypothetical protein BpHYR1_031231 [Brachionus plicatilis]|uniref:Uncharacterized protein n=1 Tax=Brachionus plicatilis TaxID=10195 RepID=A0A3M7RK43_BRAPC|nr:hypothetical protein BpHYR1_031231 [Brachionus plicatilis]
MQVLKNKNRRIWFMSKLNKESFLKPYIISMKVILILMLKKNFMLKQQKLTSKKSLFDSLMLPANQIKD